MRTRVRGVGGGILLLVSGIAVDKALLRKHGSNSKRNKDISGEYGRSMLDVDAMAAGAEERAFSSYTGRDSARRRREAYLVTHKRPVLIIHPDHLSATHWQRPVSRNAKARSIPRAKAFKKQAYVSGQRPTAAQRDLDGVRVFLSAKRVYDLRGLVRAASSTIYGRM